MVLCNDVSEVCDGLRCLLNLIFFLDLPPPAVDAEIAADDLIRNAILLLPLTLLILMTVRRSTNLYQLDTNNEKNDGTRRLCICFLRLVVFVSTGARYNLMVHQGNAIL